MNKNFFGRHARGLVFSVVVAAVPVLFSACKNSDFVPVSADEEQQMSVTEVRIKEGNNLSLNPGRKSRLTLEVLPENASDKSVSWSSDKEKIATVDGDGLVTGVAPGEAVITVTTKDGYKTATLKVTVTGTPSASISVTGVKILEGDAMSLGMGEKKRLTVEISPSDADDQGVFWSSSAPNIASITAEGGVLTAEGPGEAIITVTTKDGKKTSSLVVKVNSVAVKGVQILEGSTLALKPGDTKQLTAEVLPNNATNKYTDWSSDNINVASVTDGLVRAEAAGEATITVTTKDGNYTATLKIIVDAPADSVYTSDKPYNLTIVYFVPSEFKSPLPDYKRRISEFLNREQEYVAEWMKYWGLGDKTFGLKKNHKGEVEINVVYGKYPTEHYPTYDNIRKEVADWLNAHPDKRGSEYTFVLTANLYDGKPLPFYGRGTWAYGIDYPYMEIANMGAGGDAGVQASWIGANFHEMLHGLGLLHNGGLVSENQKYGEPILNINGGTFIVGKSYLSKWECAALSISKTFSTITRPDWRNANYTIYNLDARYDDATRKIIVSGKFTSTQKVLYVGFTNDPIRWSGDRDYDSENWVVTPTDSDNDGVADSFYTEMSIDEFTDRGDYINDFRIRLFHENGVRTGKDYTYQMVGGKPDIRFGDAYLPGRTHWTATATSQQSDSGDGSPAALLDGDVNTGWQSRRSPNPTNLPQSFTIDMGGQVLINRFSFVFGDGPGKLQNITIDISPNGRDFIGLGQYTLPDQSGLTHIRGETRYFRSFRVTITSASGNSDFAACQEVSASLD